MKTHDIQACSSRVQKLPRKLRKILVEKKRRERIDGCLKQIKELLFQGTEFQNDYMRMEKADILENVVQFLKSQNLHEQNSRLSSEYRQGYVQCMQEATQVVDSICGRNTSSLSLKQYMNNKLNNLRQMGGSMVSPPPPQTQRPSSSLNTSITSSYSTQQYRQPDMTFVNHTPQYSTAPLCGAFQSYTNKNNSNFSNLNKRKDIVLGGSIKSTGVHCEDITLYGGIKTTGARCEVLQVVPDSTSCHATHSIDCPPVAKQEDNLKINSNVIDRNMWRPW